MNTIVCIGNFDGVHRGHAALIAHAAGHGTPWVWTPAPHPRSVFGQTFGLLTLCRDKTALLHAAGAGQVRYLPFRRICLLTHREFEAELAAHRPDGICIGADFRYGRGRTGDADTLRRAGFEVRVFDDERCADGLRIASARIRAALGAGDLCTAEHLLGRPWSLTSRVVHGRRLGRELGFATANLPPGRLLMPRAGVYAVQVTLPDGRIGPAVANLGLRPTVNGTRALCEVHLFDFAENLYGQRLRVTLHSFIRDERRFADLPALRTQIAADASVAAERLVAVVATHRTAGLRF